MQTVDMPRGLASGTGLEAGDKGHGQSRKVYNTMIDCKPLVTVHCADVAGVVAPVQSGGGLRGMIRTISST